MSDQPHIVDPDDPAEIELHACLDAALGERQRRLDDLRRSSPDQARRVERLVGLLGGFGFLDDEGEPAPAQWLPTRIGGFRILELLGQGGMGSVYLAEQEGLGRRVALKVIHGGLACTPRVRERFRREAVAASRLAHPAICPVYEVGETDGTPYLAMRHVPGPTLAQRIARSFAAGRRCLALS